MKFEYYSNNSGGRNWLSSKEWLALIQSGWIIWSFVNDWSFRNKHYKKIWTETDLQENENEKSCCPQYASKNFKTPEEGLTEWRELGYLLEKLENKTVHLVIASKEDLIVPNDTYRKGIIKGTYKEPTTLPVGIYCQQGSKYALVDGYHRYVDLVKDDSL